MSSLLVFNRVYGLEMQSVMLVFSSRLVNYQPSTLLTGSTAPPSLSELVQGYVFIQCVTGGRGSGASDR
jgi:hypothetical protein